MASPFRPSAYKTSGDGGDELAIFALMDFLIGYSIEDVVDMHRLASVTQAENMIRAMILTHGYTVTGERNRGSDVASVVGTTSDDEQKAIHSLASALQDLRRLYAFVLVAEELHFRRAAKRLMMSQSPLSRTIQALEHDLGFPLFVRSRHGVKLTDAGTVFLVATRDILNRARKAITMARSINSEGRQQSST